ncbi:MAG: biotin-dependent carboxyltransferase family protein [Bacteroidota bacterium]
MAGTLTLHCLKPGGGAYLVDAGRPGFLARGIPAGGPADFRARDAANRLLGQPLDTPCLEITLTAGQWLLNGRGQIVLTGADMNWRLNGRLLEPYQVHYLDGDYLLTGTAARRGLRTYLAVLGTWELPRSLGSGETGLPDVPTIDSSWSVEVKWQHEAPFRMELEVDRHWPALPSTVTVVPGPEWSWLTETEQKRLLSMTYLVGPASNRQGIRLVGNGGVPEHKLPSLLSSPVLPGILQLTPSGLILLGPDAQTVGGYPRPLLVAEQEALATIFQVGIGEEISFKQE